MANSSIVLTTLDFPTLKNNLITWLSSQAEFKDYNFAASDLNVLIDLLTYNTYLNAFYVNMLMAESFLDSCQLKSSAISHAKELNYVPRSFTSSSAVVQLTFNSSSPTVLLQKGQSFSTTVKNKSYTFTVPTNLLLASTNGYFQANLTISEGPFVSDTYVMNSSDPTQRLVLLNPQADTNSISVVVFEDGAVIGTPYSQATTLLGLNETSQVFFLQQAETGQYEVYFGDNVVGRRPKDGSVIVLDYRVSTGDPSNGASNFVINFNPGAVASNVNVQLVSAATGGALPETIDSIRYFAPRHFAVQERAVSDPDFEVVLQEEFPEIFAVSSFGGENLTPPQFRVVVIAVAITGVDALPDSKKREYAAFLQDKMFLTGKPMIIDPDRRFVQVTTNVSYNVNQSTLTPESVQALVVNQVSNFSNANLNTFNKTLFYSKLCADIDATDASIVGNDTEILTYKKISPSPGAIVPTHFTLEFDQPFPNSTEKLFVPSPPDSVISSTPFQFAGQISTLQDDGNGGVWVVGGVTPKFVQEVGSVDYNNGVVQLLSFIPQSYDGSAIKVFAKTSDSRLPNLTKDILGDNDTILAIEASSIIVKVTPVAL